MSLLNLHSRCHISYLGFLGTFCKFIKLKQKVIFFLRIFSSSVCQFFNFLRLLLDLHIKCHMSYLGKSSKKKADILRSG